MLGGTRHHASDEAKQNALALRGAMTDAEWRLWYLLRAQRFEDHKFRRQHALGPYVVDFVCLKSKLVIELDGGQHVEQEHHDNVRSAWLIEHGFRVLRFRNDQLLQKQEAVLTVIAEALAPSLTLPLKGEGTRSEPAENAVSEIAKEIPSPFRERARERVPS